MNENEWKRLDSDVEFLVTKVKDMIFAINTDSNSVLDNDVRRMRRILKAAINRIEEFNELTELVDQL